MKPRIELLVLTPEAYHTRFVELVRARQKRKVCFVTLNKSAAASMSLLKQKRVLPKSIVFVDAVSALLGRKKNTRNIRYVRYPPSRSELYSRIKEMLPRSESVIFDSITMLAIYAQLPDVVAFTKRLITLLRKNGKEGLFYMQGFTKNGEWLRKRLEPAFDKVVVVKGARHGQ